MKPIDFEREPKVCAWKELVTESGCTIRDLKPLNLFHKKNSELLFAVLKADVVDPLGNKLPDILFVRGHACIIIPLIKNGDTGKEAFLMIRQRRIGNGMLNLEFPAGMLDRNIDNPVETAVKELFEETGLKVSAKNIFPLAGGPLYSSAGASDEGIYYFGCLITVPGRCFADFEGRAIHGVTEDEHLIVTLRTRKQAEKETASLQARLGFYLFDKVLKSRKQHEKTSRKRNNPKKPF
jgi:8-oxo-dGTP pyrophosphatase MutT (NUDIX family)